MPPTQRGSECKKETHPPAQQEPLAFPFFLWYICSINVRRTITIIITHSPLVTPRMDTLARLLYEIYTELTWHLLTYVQEDRSIK